MNEQCQQDYLNLLQAIIDSLDDEKSAILRANSDFTDSGLVQKNLQLANDLRVQGDLDAANYLMNIATHLLTAKKGDKAVYLELQIQAYQANLLVYTQEKFPYDWAETQTNLGNAYAGRMWGDKADNLEITIACYKNALLVFKYDGFPYHWAATQTNLGNAYAGRMWGDKADNLDIAIACYENALLVFTRDSSSYNWAMTQNNLGNAYRERIRGDKTDNLEIAIAYSENALLVFKRGSFSHNWAMTQNNLGLTYAQRIRGDKADNLDIAITCYENALLVFEHDDFPYKWAEIQSNLGLAYAKRIRGDKADNLEIAITRYENALLVFTRDSFSYNWAETQNNLGLACSNRIRGDKADNLEIAITCYENALLVFEHDDFPYEWAEIQNNLGNTCTGRIRREQADNLEIAITCYENALLVFKHDDFPYKWAETQSNLGLAYAKRIRGDKADNLEIAIACYQNALLVSTRDSSSHNWAMIQNNLGTVYRRRIRGDKADNLEFAIACYENALLVHTRYTFPHNWAGTQSNLGFAYCQRIRGDKVDNLEFAIACYENALLVHTRDASPYNWAMTQNNLGIAHRDRIMGDKAENLELAIACYENALLVHTRDASPYDWAMTQTNLVAAYNDRIMGDEAENLELAITCCKNALLVHTRDTSPYNWAVIQNNFGTVYRKRILGNKAENLEFAIACYENALLIHTRDTSPYDWAMTQHNLGGVYYQKTQGNKADNLELAIRHIRLALEIYTPTNLPFDCFSTAKGLGDLAFKEGLWEIAIEGYEQAVAAVELSRSWTSSDNRRQEILEEAIAVYQNLVQALINTGQLQKAIKYVESSRSRMMVDLMASNDLYSKGEIPLEVQKYLQQFESLQQQIDQERESFRKQSKNKELVGAGNFLSRAVFDAETEKIKDLEAEKQQIWENIRSSDDVLAGQIQVDTLDFAAIQQLIDTPTTAILSFYTTDDDTYIFILRQNEEPRIHTCNGQGLNTLHREYIFNNWSLPYFNDKTQWLNQMGGFLQELAERLNIQDLIAQHLENIKEIILIPHLCLHQIPFAALPINSPQGELLGDRFLIRYAPSCQILKFCNDRKPIEMFCETSPYGIVENATDDLCFTSFECEKIAQIVVNSQRLQGSQQAIVRNYRQLAKTVNILHSSHHAQSRLDNPLESRLCLGDGDITLGELMSPGWRLRQLSEVFLSCCETNFFGLSTITDDVLTLSAGFLCAGARSVINTLWSVDDLATALFSIFYYEYRQLGYNRAEAVRKAQVKLRGFSGEELKNKYQAELESMLDEKKKQAENDRRAVRTQRQQQVKGTAAYKELDDKYQKIAKLLIKISRSEKRLTDSCQQALPFNHPMYWAAFTCQGMR